MPIVQSLLTEILRPKDLKKIILLDRVRKLLGNGTLEQNVLLESSPGTGKTTIGKILAQGHSTLYINVSEEGRIDFLRDQLTEFCSTRSMIGADGEYKVVILDEADYGSITFYAAMRSLIEKYAGNVRFIATCNYVNKIPDPILSRFCHIKFEPQTKEEEEELTSKYAVRVKSIAKRLKMQFDSDDTVLEFIKKSFPDFRSLVSSLQTMNIADIETITIDDIKRSSSGIFEPLFELLIKKPDPIANYKFIMSEYQSKVDEAFLAIGTVFPEWLEEHSPGFLMKLPIVLINVANSEFQSRGSIDKILNLLSCVFSIQQSFYPNK